MIDINKSEIVKDFFQSLNVNELSEEYIQSAQITRRDGDKKMISGEQLGKLLNGDPDFDDVHSTRLFLNVQKVYSAIELETEFIYFQVKEMGND